MTIPPTTSDVATLTDSAIGALYSGSGSTGALSASSYSISISQFGTVNLIGAAGATNQLSVGAINYTLHKIGTWTNA